MMYRKITIAFVMALLAGPANALPNNDSAAVCRVTHITDGDTLRLTCGGGTHKVRLLGYDTPEIFHPLCPAELQAGQKATEVMRSLIASGPVTAVRFQGHDRYGRVLADLQVGGRDVRAVMLASGLALPYKGRKHPNWCKILGG